MVSALIGELLPWAIGIVAALAGLWGYGKKRERDGVAKQRMKQQDADRRSARETRERVEDALDDARDVPAIDRLRSKDRLRD